MFVFAFPFEVIAQNTFNIYICLCRFFYKTIFFQEYLHFKETIILCYNKQNTMKTTTRVPLLLTWQTS
jgi:hypothetical protein